MLIFNEKLPISLYIHIPWCVQKCPYCDFNSHPAKTTLPEELYVNALIQELESRLQWLQNRSLTSIFFGGGTPSLFSTHAIDEILNAIAKRIHLPTNMEITLEANPGTIDENHFAGYRAAGINRLSLGIQSLQDEKLKILGRIHNRDSALRAVHLAKKAGFKNLNVDLMYGLPQQTLSDAFEDLEMALTLEPNHLSWYQLTIEPNTLFYKQKPTLPGDDKIWEMQSMGEDLLKAQGYHHYEVSAYAKPEKECVHNRNYWEFGDYLGLGAGAHSKITDHTSATVFRSAQVRQPKDYLDHTKRQKLNVNFLSEKDLIFEFMLNALRLTEGVPSSLFYQHTGIPLKQIEALLVAAQQRGLMKVDKTRLVASELGQKFLNDLMAMFLDVGCLHKNV